MSEFEFLFVLFSLVMGLSLVELLTGLGRALELRLAQDERRQGLKFGWLSPLLAVFVILDLLSFWMFAWAIRDLIKVTSLSTLGVVAFCGAYFLAARLVFPSQPERYRDLDNHYFEIRRTVFAMLIVMVAIQWAFVLTQPSLAAAASSPLTLGLTALLLALMLAAMVIRNKAASIAVLAALVLRYLLVYVT